MPVARRLLEKHFNERKAVYDFLEKKGKDKEAEAVAELATMIKAEYGAEEPSPAHIKYLQRELAAQRPGHEKHSNRAKEGAKKRVAAAREEAEAKRNRLSTNTAGA